MTSSPPPTPTAAPVTTGGGRDPAGAVAAVPGATADGVVAGGWVGGWPAVGGGEVTAAVAEWAQPARASVAETAPAAAAVRRRPSRR